MYKSNWISLAAVIAFLATCSAVVLGQTMNVKIVQRHDSETAYTYVVPGHFDSTSDTDLNCRAGSTNVNCSGTTTTNGTVTASREISYSVTGATFSLLLPDGRIAVVNCVSKYSYKYGGGYDHQRSCRTPLVDDVQVEFKDKNAKLIWPAGVNGKTFESETYRILAVLDKKPTAETITPTPPPAPITRPAGTVANLTVDSNVPGADIEIDGAFVGNTPSTVSAAPGSHQIVVKKKGFADWTKTLSVTGGTVHLNAELEKEPAKQ